MCPSLGGQPPQYLSVTSRLPGDWGALLCDPFLTRYPTAYVPYNPPLNHPGSQAAA
jgi:hypothetical protein